MKKMKKILPLICFFASISCYSQVNYKSEWLKKQKSDLRNYAFCSCISYLDSTRLQDLVNDGSKAGYFEITNYDLDAYHLIDSVAKKYASKQYSSINQKPLGLMKCLDFYNSKELKVLINALEKELHYPK